MLVQLNYLKTETALVSIAPQLQYFHIVPLWHVSYVVTCLFLLTSAASEASVCSFVLSFIPTFFPIQWFPKLLSDSMLYSNQWCYTVFSPEEVVLGRTSVFSIYNLLTGRDKQIAAQDQYLASTLLSGLKRAQECHLPTAGLQYTHAAYGICYLFSYKTSADVGGTAHLVATFLGGMISLSSDTKYAKFHARRYSESHQFILS